MGDAGIPSSSDMTDQGASSGTQHMNLHQMLEQARSYKKDGNEFYKQGEYKKAVGKYHRGLLYIRGIDNAQQQFPFLPSGIQHQHQQPTPSSQSLAEIIRLKIDLHNNLAACLLQMDSPRYDRICQYCEKVLEEQPDNPKAMYRQAVSLYHLKDTEKALTLLRRLQELGHKDPNTRRYTQLCEEEQARQDAKMKQAYKGMFSKLSDEKQT